MKRYTATHEWFETAAEGERRIRVGISAHAAEQLGSIVYVELPAPDRAVAAGDSLAVIESVKAVGDVYAPCAGVVVEAHSDLRDHPERIGDDPEGAGWIAVLEVDDPSAMPQGMDADAYRRMLAEQA